MDNSLFPNVVAAGIGFAMGVGYAFDGWRASRTATSLDKTVRIKNFLWVIGGAFTTLAIDFKALFPASDRGYLLGFYFASFLVTAFGIIGCNAISAALDIGSLKRESPQRFPDRPFRPVSDYLFYGYEYYKKSYQEAVDKKAAAWQARKSRATPESKKEYAHIVLTYICAVVKAYYRQADKNLEITANYMKVYPLGDDRMPDPRFVDPEKPTHDRVLVVEDSSSDSDEAFPLLPIERENKLKSLPGAPLALLAGGDQIENDTRNIEFQEKLHSKVKKSCKDFFKDKAYSYRHDGKGLHNAAQ